MFKGLEDLSELQYLSCCENHLPVLEGLYNCHVLQHLLVAQNNLQQVLVIMDQDAHVSTCSLAHV